MAESAGVGLVAGLGNPDNAHARNRHNAGFWFLDALAADVGVSLRNDARFRGLAAKTADGVWLMQPQLYMNRSGEGVAGCARYFKIPVERILIIHDELELDPGIVRLKRGGGHGGHNGLRDVVSHLRSSDFLRLRLGIGHPGSDRDVSAYVLRDPPMAERQAIKAAIKTGIECFADIIAANYEHAAKSLSRHVPTPPGA